MDMVNILWLMCFIIIHSNSKLLSQAVKKSSNRFLVNTPGCKIPNFETPFNDDFLNLSCGERIVEVKKISGNRVRFVMRKHVTKCCFSYYSPVNDIKAYRYTPCENFKNNTVVVLKHEFIKVQCGCGKNLYEDYYAIVIKQNKNTTESNNRFGGNREGNEEYNKESDENNKESQENNKRSYDINKSNPVWNVLMIGMDTTSRARAYNSLPETVGFFRKNYWMDFRGYNKVASNSRPNIIPLLTGQRMDAKGKTSIKNICAQNSTDACHNLIIWTRYRRAGYMIGFSEDALCLESDIYFSNGFHKGIPPTDHSLRSLFNVETHSKDVYCTGRISSAQQTLDYALDFIQTYRSKQFFGYFKMTSLTHDKGSSPKAFDKSLRTFLEQLERLGVFDNTFVIFFGDHGERFGVVRQLVTGYYEERLPALFISVPFKFTKQYPKEFLHLKQNQNRIISPFDLHMTLRHIGYNFKEIPRFKTDSCLSSRSLFEYLSGNRSCGDSCVDDTWCTCRFLYETSSSDASARTSIIKAADDVQRRSLYPTKDCFTCSELSLNKLLRIHYFLNGSSPGRFYIIAFTAGPDNLTVEVTVRRSLDVHTDTFSYKVLDVSYISSFVSKTSCLKKVTKGVPVDAICDCKLNSTCSQKLNRAFGLLFRIVSSLVNNRTSNFV